LAAAAILDEKKRRVSAKFGPSARHIFAAPQPPRRQQKQSINYAGKETNALRRSLPATLLLFLGGALRAFIRQARF
jgi:hypothetical protein